MRRFSVTGLTVVELLTVALIFVLILAAIYGVLTMGRRSWQIGTTQVELQQEARKAMDSIIRELRFASSVDETTFTAGISNDIIRFTTEEGTIEFTLNAEAQLLRTSSATTAVVANNIAAIQFYLFGGDVVHIILTTQRTTVLGHPVVSSLNSQVSLRN